MYCNSLTGKISNRCQDCQLSINHYNVKGNFPFILTWNSSEKFGSNLTIKPVQRGETGSLNPNNSFYTTTFILSFKELVSFAIGQEG